MLTAKMKRRLARLGRQLGVEQLEHRNLLATGSISGTVFEDLDADGVRGPGEGGLEGWTVVLERTDAVQTFANPAPDPHDGFGIAVVATPDKVVIGARYEDAGAVDSGAAYVFDWEGSLLHTLDNPSPDAEDQFGWHLAVNGNKLLVGVNLDDAGDENSGAVHLFDIATGEL
jgi:hypothetical protein